MLKRLLIAVFIVLFASSAHATWTITPTVWSKTTTRSSDMVVIKLACTSDASSTDYEIGSTSGVDHEDIMGYYYYGVMTIPGTGDDAPSGTFDLDVENSFNYHIHDTDAHAADANEFTRGSSSINAYYPVTSKDPISVVIGTLGTGNKADIYLFFVK